MTRSIDSYVTLGRSGLRVSPLSLGTMTFGTEWGWGSEEQVARAVFDKYIEAGGNFLDTANVYTEGHSEELLGKFILDRGLRHRVVDIVDSHHGAPESNAFSMRRSGMSHMIATSTYSAMATHGFTKASGIEAA